MNSQNSIVGEITPTTVHYSPKPIKKPRGSYTCGRCGLPKKGHSCSSIATPAQSVPRRILSFGDVTNMESPKSDADVDDLSPNFPSQRIPGEIPPMCVWEVMKRLPPASVLCAANVCRVWRETARRIWRFAEELTFRVPPRAHIGHVGSLLQKCQGLISLNLTLLSDVDATMLACIAFSCPNLQSLEILMSDDAINRITGDELDRFVANKRFLSTLKVEGCCYLGSFTLNSSSLSTLWLSNLHSLSKMVFNFPNLREIALDFSRQENDSTDLTAMVTGLGRSCPRLIRIHIASVRISHAVVLALTDADLREVRMLSLVLGSEITDASVAAIVLNYSRLELLDLSGSSISDSGIRMICNVFSATLSRLLLALCPSITSSGVQFATVHLPLLEIMDCGMTICDPNSQSLVCEQKNCDVELQKTPNVKQHISYQKLIIKHDRLKKFSLWGCSGLDALCLNCQELNDLNLKCCANLDSKRLLLQCPNLEIVYASGCQPLLIEAIQNQVRNNFNAAEYHLPSKRLVDIANKRRIRAPCIPHQQPSCMQKRRHCNVLVD